MLNRLKYLFKDPPPLLVFEISEQAVAGVRRNARTLEVESRAFRGLEAGVVDATPGKPNVQRPEEYARAVREVFEELGPARRPDVALILPDSSSRLTVMDFDSLPSDANERLRLIRWRLKKTVPFDIESARIAFQAWPAGGGASVLVAVTPPEVVHQYEDPFERLGLWPGFVSLSTVVTLKLAPDGDMTLLAKLAGRSLTMAALQRGMVRMVRCVDLPPNIDLGSPRALDDIFGDLYPTLVFVNDNLGVPVSKVVVSGFGGLLPACLQRLPRELHCDVEPLGLPAGSADGFEAGIWGYVHGN